MEDALILETTFLVDFERERQQGEGAAVAFLRQHNRYRLFITHTVAGELAAGKSLADHERWLTFLAPFRILLQTKEVDWHYGKAFRFLQINGIMIETNDLWIAATALAYELPVVTRNADHYRRIRHLEVVPYR